MRSGIAEGAGFDATRGAVRLGCGCGSRLQHVTPLSLVIRCTTGRSSTDRNRLWLWLWRRAAGEPLCWALVIHYIPADAWPVVGCKAGKKMQQEKRACNQQHLTLRGPAAAPPKRCPSGSLW